MDQYIYWLGMAFVSVENEVLEISQYAHVDGRKKTKGHSRNQTNQEIGFKSVYENVIVNENVIINENTKILNQLNHEEKQLKCREVLNINFVQI